MDEKQTQDILNVIAETISDFIPGMGFALLVFPFYNPGRANYVSNAQRQDMVRALREAAERISEKKESYFSNSLVDAMLLATRQNVLSEVLEELHKGDQDAIGIVQKMLDDAQKEEE